MRGVSVWASAMPAAAVVVAAAASYGLQLGRTSASPVASNARAETVALLSAAEDLAVEAPEALFSCSRGVRSTSKREQESQPLGALGPVEH